MSATLRLLTKSHNQQKLMSETNLKDKKDRLRLFQEDNQSWIEHSPTCTKIVDMDFNLQFMSSAGIRSLGIDDISKYYGKPYPFEFYPESFRDGMIRNMIKARDSAKVVKQEDSVVDLDGNEVWFNSTIIPVCESGKQTEFFMIVSVDSTSENQEKSERLYLNDELEIEVHRRTLELDKVNKHYVQKCEQADIEHKIAINKLEKALAEVKILKGLIPICSYCKVVRNKENEWESLESYITYHLDAQFTHGICPECYTKVIEESGLDNKK